MIERKELRAAIDAHKTAVEAVAKDEDMLARARRYEATLAAELDGYADLDQRIETARAEALKAALAADAAPRLADAPEGFARDRLRCDFLTAELAACRKSIEILAAELTRAQDEAARLDLAREHAAERVMAADAEQMATDFIRRVTDLRRLSYLLNAVVARQVRRAPHDRNAVANVPSHLYGSGPYRRIDLAPIAHEAAREAILGEYESRHGFGLRNETSAAVAALWERLKTDADAALNDRPEPPAADTVVATAARRPA